MGFHPEGNLPQKRRHLPEQRLEGDAAVFEVGLLGGDEHGVGREVGGEGRRLGQVASGHYRSEQGAREHVARAVQHVGQLGVGGFREVDGVAPHVVVDEAVAVLDALQHHVLRAALAQLQDHLAHRGLVHVGALPLAAQDDSRLGEVRREDVGAVGQRPHGFHEFWRVGGVHLAVIGHDRIHYAPTPA